MQNLRSEPQAVVAGSPPTAASLQATALVDSEHPAVKAFANEYAVGATDVERAVALNLAVRDKVRYDPYTVDLSPEGMRASTALKTMRGWCVPKAALLVAVCRAAGIPARLGYADVRNHLSTERMRETMQTDLFIWHGYADIWLEEAPRPAEPAAPRGDQVSSVKPVLPRGQWRKATPAFNIELCQRFGLLPLEFDGRSDSIYHPFDASGNRHMEYVNQRGAFEDMPLATIVGDFKKLYPRWLEDKNTLQGESFEDDVKRELG